MIVRSTVPTDAGVYKCSIRTKTDATISTKARLLVGGEWQKYTRALIKHTDYVIM